MSADWVGRPKRRDEESRLLQKERKHKSSASNEKKCESKRATKFEKSFGWALINPNLIAFFLFFSRRQIKIIFREEFKVAVVTSAEYDAQPDPLCLKHTTAARDFDRQKTAIFGLIYFDNTK
jgi:hypothetical protein